MKVVHLTSVHDVDDIRIFTKECQSIQKAGYEVIFVVPNSEDVTDNGVKIKGVNLPGEGRLARMTKIVYSIYKECQILNAEMYHFHDPELIPVGLALKASGKKVIYDVHEDVPRQILSKYWIPKYLRKLVSFFFEKIEGIASHYFDAIVVVTPSIQRRFLRYNQNTVTVENFPLIMDLFPGNEVSYKDREMVIAYVGGLTEVRGINEMVNAIGEIPSSYKAKLMLAGNFSPPNLKEAVSRLPGWARVEYLGWQNRQGIQMLLAKAKVGLVTLHPIPNYIDSYPVKLFEYMAAGVPVVASDFPLWREIIQESGCGILVNPLDHLQIAEAIQWLLEHPCEAEVMGRNGREAVLSKYNWDIPNKKLIELYNGLKINKPQ